MHTAPRTEARLYGTETYTDDSPICAAAIHAGVVKPGVAAAVTIIPGNGEMKFQGSVQNGIESQDYERWGFWYRFAPDGTLAEITWATAWRFMPPEFEGPVELLCPPGGDAGKGLAYGTDVYTTESKIRIAAVHTGAISAGNGGPVIVVRAPGQDGFKGSEQNGVASRNAGGSRDAFTVTAGTGAPEPAVADAPPEPPPDPDEPVAGEPPADSLPDSPPDSPTAPGCVTPAGTPAVCITTAGFAGVGAGHVAAPPVDPNEPATPPAPTPPLAVATTGFSGVGAGHVPAPPVNEYDPADIPAPLPPVTVTTPGFSGAGAGYVEETNDEPQ